MTARPLLLRLAPFLVPVALLAAVGLAVRLVLRPPDGLTGTVLGLGGLALVLWIVVSTLWPARAERRCPSCGKRTLERLERRSAVGVRCGACGFVDPARSAWTLAEEEGPLEGMVLDSRSSRRRRSPVDSRRAPH